MASSSSAEQQIASPPTYRFRPTKRELVEFYLLPRARGQQDAFPGVIFEDDAAGSTLPWDLFARHGVGGEDEAYFVVRGGEATKARRHGGARQDRGCDGGVGTWKMQSSHERSLRVRRGGGERVRVHVSNLNLHMGRGRSSSGSVGWVMHEYTVAAPPCPSPVKICHIAFSGHGRKRMRVPDGQQVRQSPFPGSSSSSEFQGFTFAASEQYHPGLEAQVPTTDQQDMVAPQLMAQQSATPVGQQLSAGELEFWSSIGVDVQNSNCFEQEQSTGPGVQSSQVVPDTDAMATGFQSSCAVPNNGAMATGVRSSLVAGDLDGFCRSLLAVRTNCVAPDFGNMATGTLGGGCSLICK